MTTRCLWRDVDSGRLVCLMGHAHHGQVSRPRRSVWRGRILRTAAALALSGVAYVSLVAINLSGPA